MKNLNLWGQVMVCGSDFGDEIEAPIKNKKKIGKRKKYI